MVTTARARTYRTTARRWVAVIAAGCLAYVLLHLAWSQADEVDFLFILVLSTAVNRYGYWTGRREEHERIVIDAAKEANGA